MTICWISNEKHWSEHELPMHSQLRASCTFDRFQEKYLAGRGQNITSHVKAAFQITLPPYVSVFVWYTTKSIKHNLQECFKTATLCSCKQNVVYFTQHSDITIQVRLQRQIQRLLLPLMYILRSWQCYTCINYSMNPCSSAKVYVMFKVKLSSGYTTNGYMETLYIKYELKSPLQMYILSSLSWKPSFCTAHPTINTHA